MGGEPPLWSFDSDDALIEHFGFLWRTYACEDDSNMTRDACELKRKLVAAMNGVPKWLDRELEASHAEVATLRHALAAVQGDAAREMGKGEAMVEMLRRRVGELESQ